MKESKHLNIAVAADTNYADFVSVLLVSLFENNKDFEFVTIYLLSNGIVEQKIDEIKDNIPKGEESQIGL